MAMNDEDDKPKRKRPWMMGYREMHIYRDILDGEIGEPDGHCFQKHWERQREKDLPERVSINPDPNNVLNPHSSARTWWK